MRQLIPNDWDGETWQCIRIQWPKSVYWDAILRGLIEVPSHGRTWDEKTGSISAVQDIGREIWSKNIPFRLCEEGNEPIYVEGEKIVIYGHEFNSEDILKMSLCGYNPKAFKIENGKLYVRDFCGDWVEIGEVGDMAGIPGDPYPEGWPEPLGSATACTKALKLARLTHEIMNVAFDACDILDLDFIWGWYDFADHVNKEFPNIKLGDTDLYNLFGLVYALEAAGMESETEDDDIRQSLACAWEPILEAGPYGVTSEQYEEMKTILSSVLRSVVGDSAYSGFGQTIRNAWERAFSAIGQNDVQKVTTNLIAAEDENCACPGDISPLEPVEGGWYLGELQQVTFDFTDTKEDSYTQVCHVPEHDVYGLFAWAEINSIDGTFQRWSKTGSTGGCAHDVMLTQHSSTLDLDEDMMHIQFDDSPATALYNAMDTDKTKELSVLGPRSTNVASPIMESGETGQVQWFAQALSGGTGNITVHWRLVHNTGSPSHV